MTDAGKLITKLTPQTEHMRTGENQVFPPGPCHRLQARWDRAVESGASPKYFEQLLSAMVGPACGLEISYDDETHDLLTIAPAPYVGATPNVFCMGHDVIAPAPR